MKDTMRIGTLVGGGDAVRVIPQIVGHGFESFSLTFWQTTGKTDLVETGKRVQELAAEHDFVISSVGIFGNPLTNTGDNSDAIASWERLIDHAHLFGTDMVSGFTGRLPGYPLMNLFRSSPRCLESCPKEQRIAVCELPSRTVPWVETGDQVTGILLTIH